MIRRLRKTFSITSDMVELSLSSPAKSARGRPGPAQNACFDLWDLANAYLQAGKREEAIGTLFKGLPRHEPGLLQIRVDPDFDSLRSDPRYAELVRQIGFPTEEQ